MKDYDKNKGITYLQYWDVNNLHGWAILQKFTVNSFEWIKDANQFNEEVFEGYFLEVNGQYLEKLHELHNHLPFLPERIKVEKKPKSL